MLAKRQMQIIAPFRVQRYKFHISKMLEKNEDRVKTQNTIRALFLNRVQE